MQNKIHNESELVCKERLFTLCSRTPNELYVLLPFLRDSSASDPTKQYYFYLCGALRKIQYNTIPYCPIPRTSVSGPLSGPRQLCDPFILATFSFATVKEHKDAFYCRKDYFQKTYVAFYGNYAHATGSCS